MHPTLTEPATQQTQPTPNRSNLPLLALPFRLVLFLVFQAIAAGILALQGAPSPWRSSIAWWPVGVTLTNLICFLLLRAMGRREGLTWAQLIHADFGRQHLKGDLLALLGVLLLCGPVAMVPNLGLAQLLWGDMEGGVRLFIQPLPTAIALICLFSFPITQAFGELPTYFAYAMPRLAERWSSKWRAILVAALWLGLQHLTLPFIPDWRFILWRAVMFIPFAILLGWAVTWRPRLLPYLMVVHAIIDFPVAMMYWQASIGG